MLHVPLCQFNRSNQKTKGSKNTRPNLISLHITNNYIHKLGGLHCTIKTRLVLYCEAQVTRRILWNQFDKKNAHWRFKYFNVSHIHMDRSNAKSNCFTVAQKVKEPSCIIWILTSPIFLNKCMYPPESISKITFELICKIKVKVQEAKHSYM